MQNIFDLTPREIEILARLKSGLLYKEIAKELNIQLDTVKKHCYNIYGKIGARNKTEAINNYYNSLKLLAITFSTIVF
jgi:two-component system, NarL family, response regulator LiaR